VSWPAALDPAGVQSARIAALWWWFFGVAVVVWTLVTVMTLVPALQRRRRASLPLMPGGEPFLGSPSGSQPGEPLVIAPLVPHDAARERRLLVVVTSLGVLTTLILVGLLIASVGTGRALTSEFGKEALEVDVTGHQFWWEVTYPNDTPALQVATANEIHVPVGKTVRVKLQATDVIHSFWVPRLHGKTDLIPGRTTWMWLRADRPGVYVGQCAEFCGYQHAHMAFLVVAEESGRFAAWLGNQRAPASIPTTPAQTRGQEVFLHNPCVMCHNIRGTIAGGAQAPDLTHVGSRLTLAAGTLPNRLGHLAGWVMDAQGIKPGSNMPTNRLSGADLQALLAYLRSLT